MCNCRLADSCSWFFSSRTFPKFVRKFSTSNGRNSKISETRPHEEFLMKEREGKRISTIDRFSMAHREKEGGERGEGSNLLRQVVSYPLRKAIAGEWEKRIWNRPWQTRYYRSAYRLTRVNNIVGSHNLFFCGRDRGQWDETLVSWSSLVPCRKETRRGWWKKRRRKRRKERKNEE